MKHFYRNKKDILIKKTNGNFRDEFKVFVNHSD